MQSCLSLAYKYSAAPFYKLNSHASSAKAWESVPNRQLVWLAHMRFSNLITSCCGSSVYDSHGECAERHAPQVHTIAGAGNLISVPVRQTGARLFPSCGTWWIDVEMRVPVLIVRLLSSSACHRPPVIIRLSSSACHRPPVIVRLSSSF